MQGRLPYRTISTTSAPTTARVQAWLDEAQSTLDNYLLAAALPAPYTGAAAVAALGILITDYAEGRTRMAYAAAGGDGSNDDGKDLVAGFNAALKSIKDDPAWWGMMLGAGAAPGPALFLRSYVTDNADGLSVAAGDFLPKFKIGETF